MHCGENMNFPRANAAKIADAYAIGFGNGDTGSGRNFDSGFRRDQTRTSFLHDDRDIEKMIDVSVRNQDCIRVRRKMRHRIINALPTWLDRIRENHLRHSDPGKIGIDEQNVAADFKLVAVGSEISDPQSGMIPSLGCGVRYDKLRIIIQTGAP